ncbi:MAG: DUF4388 domain-containing protein [Deltaproteobacteria bacterium]|nr:DUF4388 domain-containing protein [Deltaproteobacteria bacterium]
MPLRGTIRDFGIADIFQLISQQTKSGVLILRDDVDEVKVSFLEGSVVRAESPTRAKHMLLGSMLVNANLLRAETLEEAVKEQSRTLERIGAILLKMGAVSTDDLRETLRLQMTETVYRLFLWETGSYEFEQTDVPPPDEGIDPIRAENILLEGLRMIDEWPSIRRRLPAYSTVFTKKKPLPESKDPGAELGGDVFGFDGEQGAGSDTEIGEAERRIFGLVEDGRTLQEIIHRSRLGEFEACRSVVHLLGGEFIAEADVAKPEAPVPSQKPRRIPAIKFSVSEVVGRTAVYALLAALALALVRFMDREAFGLRLGHTIALEDRTTQHRIASSQIRVLLRAAEIFRFSTGRYPETLEALVDAGLVGRRDLRWPFDSEYHYRVDGDRVSIYPPLY